jgi:hypothetical protein
MVGDALWVVKCALHVYGGDELDFHHFIGRFVVYFDDILIIVLTLMCIFSSCGSFLLSCQGEVLCFHGQVFVHDGFCS